MFLTNSSNVFLLEPCQDVPKLLDNQVEVCKGVLSIYRHMIMEHTMNTQTWSVRYAGIHRIFPQISLFVLNWPDFFGNSQSLPVWHLSFSVCDHQGADAAGIAQNYRGSDEEATGKPKKRQLCWKFGLYTLQGKSCFYNKWIIVCFSFIIIQTKSSSHIMHIILDR